MTTSGARSDDDDGRAAAVRARVAQALAGLPLGRVEVVGRTASTSTDLVEHARTGDDAWPDRSVLVADHQAAGRGRAGRTWTTPPGSALTVSLLLRPPVPVERFGWVPLLAGLAVVRAVGQVAAVPARVKWPNDVLVPAPDGTEVAGWGTQRKVAGVLADLVLPGPAVVVGIGVNVAQRAEELPVPSATSLGLVAGRQVDRVDVLAALVRHLLVLDERWRSAEGDAREAGVAAECEAVCATLGAAVRVELPGGQAVHGRATALADDGALEVTGSDGRVRLVHAGDVHHLRTAVN